MKVPDPVWYYEPTERGLLKRHAIVTGETGDPGKVHLSVFMHPESDVRIRGCLPVETRRNVEVADQERKASAVPYCVPQTRAVKAKAVGK